MEPRKKYRLLILLPCSALLLTAWANSGFSAIRFDVIGSPTEAINTGRSEVLGSITLVVLGAGNVTGTSGGGATLISIAFTNPAVQIDNSALTGIRVSASPGFAAANPSLVAIENRQNGNSCAGYLLLSLLPGAAPVQGDFVQIDGIRGRIDASTAIVSGTDLYADLQAVSDPIGTSFTRDRIRVAKSFEGMKADVLTNPMRIVITEAFARAFVDADANDDGANANDRVDSYRNALGAPTNSTQFIIRLEGIPSGVSQVVWPATSTVFAASGAVLRLVSSTYSQGVSDATYSFEAANQAGGSDLVIESFTVAPAFVLSGCSPGTVSATVTLGPVVPAASGCAGPLDNVARPRFIESYQPLIDHLAPDTITVGSPGFVMEVFGIGFVPGAKVRWNSDDLPTTFISNSQLEVSVPAEKIAVTGSADISVALPVASGGNTSNSATFMIAASRLSLFFPSAASAERGRDEFTGIALVNLSSTRADLTLTAYNALGARISGDAITNPAVLTLMPGQQLSVIDIQIFGQGLLGAATAAWIQVEGNNPDVSGFFLNFDSGVSRLDGTDVSGATLSSFVFPDAGAGTSLRIANPNDGPAAVNLRLMKADGTVRAATDRTIEAKGILNGNLDTIFPGIPSEASDYIRAESSVPLVPHESVDLSSGDNAALRGQDADAEATTLYSPQYVVGGPDMQSVLSVVNLDAHPGSVRFRFVADNGSQIGITRELPISGMGKILVSEQDFFLNPGSSMKQGAVEITGIGVRLTGSIMFDGAAPGKFLTSVPLTPARQARMLFGQVASDDMYYTGLAIYNPESLPTQAYIQVYDRDGNSLAVKSEELPAGGRVSRLLTEYFPELAERKISGGYIVVDTITPVSAFAVFGTKNLTALAAVPSQIR